MTDGEGEQVTPRRGQPGGPGGPGRPPGVRAGERITIGPGQVMVRDPHGLTPMQSRFVTEVVEGGGSIAEAARRAGYADARAGNAVARLPHVAAAIQAEQRRILGGEMVGLALRALRAVMTDPEAHHRDKIAAARIVLDRGGFGPSKPDMTTGEDKPLEEMTVPELEARLRKVLGQAIDVTPASDPEPAPSPVGGETPSQSEEATA